MIDKILDVVLEILFFFRRKRKGRRLKRQVDAEDRPDCDPLFRHQGGQGFHGRRFGGVPPPPWFQRCGVSFLHP